MAITPRALARTMARTAARRLAGTPLCPAPAGRPVLVIGSPRSGTSWTGATLAEGSDTAYLREPLTYHLLRRSDLGPLTVGELPVGGELDTLARAAFAGQVQGLGDAPIRPREWLVRRPRRIVVKEVVPFALPMLAERHDPHVVAVFRHPGGVLNSWLEFGWQDVGPRTWTPATEPLRTVDDPIGRIGGFLALQERVILEVHASEDARTQLVRYEDLCREPVASFQAIYAQCGLAWDAATAQGVRRRSNGPRAGDPLARDSALRHDRWRLTLPPDVRDRLRQGYQAFGGVLYDDWWLLVPETTDQTTRVR